MAHGLGVSPVGPRVRRRRAPMLTAMALAASAIPACAGVQRHAPPAPAAVVNRVFQVDAAVQSASAAQAHVEVIAPSGARIRIPAFPLPGRLAARVRPREPGLHRWRMLESDTGGAPLATGAFRAVDTGAPGQVVARGAALATEEGRPFHPLGENRFNLYDPEWTGGLSPEDYVSRMARAGMNALRVFVFTACGRSGAPAKRGCLEPALGFFDERAAEEYDAIFQAAEAHGVKVVLSVFALGFSPGDAWKGWEENPYSSARGGPAPEPRDFFTAQAARQAARRRLRYVLARWSASPALLSVDLLNEPEWDGSIPESAWIPWAEELARAWRSEDPYGHPVTAGPVGLHWNVERDERPWWASSECDVVQWHRYGPDVYEVHDLAEALISTVRDTARYGKPVLIGEFAFGGEAKPLYDHTHVGLWAATFAGAGVLAHTAPVFQVDSDEPMTPERARHFQTLAAFLASAERREPLRPAPDPRASLPGLRVLALGGSSTLALWLHAPRRGYEQPVRGTFVEVRGLAPGRWAVTWIDDVSGAQILREERVFGPDASLAVPPFTRHVAALLERIDEARGGD